MTLTESISGSPRGPGRPGFAWTDERVGLLTRCWADGLTGSQIALEIGGVSRCAVIGKARRLGLPMRTYPGAPRPTPKARASRAKPPHLHKRMGRPAKAALLEAALAEAGLPQDSSEHAVSLLDVKDGQCRWPVNSDGEPFLFCGAEQWGDHSYCVRHFAMSRRDAKPFITTWRNRGRAAA